jgi:type VI secretion system protein ImpG
MVGDADTELLGYYLKEMDYLRTAGAAFAKTHPHLAAGLDLRAWPNEDPQMARLLESFAILTADLRRRFEDQFPEIPAGLLEAIYPQLVAPAPSMAIAQFTAKASQAKAFEGLGVPPGTSLYATTPSNTECRFRTGFPLTLWPMEVTFAQLQRPGDLMWDVPRDVQLCLRVRLICQGGATFETFKPQPLRFFLDGVRATQFKLYELLCNRLLRVDVEWRSETGGASSRAPLKSAVVSPYGLDLKDAMLPYRENAHLGYGLLQEFFAFPDKFLFVELSGLQPGAFGAGKEVDLLFMLSEEPDEPLNVDSNSLRLGCVPIINLFPRTSDPIRLDHLSLEYRLEGDTRQSGVTEIHTVQRVSRSSTSNDASDDIHPYFNYAYHPADVTRGPVARWIARRQPSSNPTLGGSEIWLSFVDPAMRPTRPADDILFAQTLCTNRGLARQLPSRTPLQIESGLAVGQIVCLTKPTPQGDPPLGGETLWRLVSHLSLNSLSLTQGADSLRALQGILALYAGADDVNRSRGQIDGLESLETRSVARALTVTNRYGANDRRFVRGLEIDLKFKDEKHIGRGDYLLASILERFFALYVGVNSFTRLVIQPYTGEGVWKQWPPRAGDRFVL